MCKKMCINIVIGGLMKRKEILRKLAKLGFEMQEGGNHTKIYKDGVRVSVLSRQNDIDEIIVKEIEKQIGIKLN